MLFKPLSARVWWVVSALCILYLYSVYHVYSSSSSSSHPASAPACAGMPEQETTAPWQEELHRGRWLSDPATEDYDAMLAGADRNLVDELLLESEQHKGTKEARITQFYGLRTVEDWGVWMEGLDEEGLAPLTKFTQRYLHTRQHPSSCADHQFLLLRKYPNDESFGLGAVIQSLSSLLSLALRTNRILIYDPPQGPGMHFLSPPPPSASGAQPCGRSLDCIFHPLTNCTLADAMAREDTIAYPWASPVSEELFRTHPNALPPVLGQAVRELYPDLGVDGAKYWWRGQVAAYSMRPNAATMQRLLELRRDAAVQRGFEGGGGGVVEVPGVMPRGAWSMHVRHGDKGIEMKLVGLENYVRRAEEYVLRNPNTARRIAFLSTEDSAVVEEARNISRLLPNSDGRGWVWYWSDIPRFNGGPEDQLQMFGNRTEMTIKWLLQLTMALECDNFVGTRGSGWNRLIDELRCTWFASCRSAYLEVGTDQSWAHYGF